MRLTAALAACSIPAWAGSLDRILESKISDPHVSYVLADLRTAEAVAQRWERADEPVPVGSLIKPFAALAWAAAHEYRYPALECRGCWLPRGHGKVGIREAVAQSCNSYFLKLASETRSPPEFGLILPTAATPLERIGEGSAARFTPWEVIRAYLELYARTAEPGVRPILDGMRLAARNGTARALGSGYAKTGTAPCTHVPKAPGDGFVLVLWPAEQCRYALLLRRHGAPGARAAETAAEVLEWLR